MNNYKFIIESPSVLIECEEVSKLPDDVCYDIKHIDKCIYKKRFSKEVELFDDMTIKYYVNVAYVTTSKTLSFGSTIILN